MLWVLLHSVSPVGLRAVILSWGNNSAPWPTLKAAGGIHATSVVLEQMCDGLCYTIYIPLWQEGVLGVFRRQQLRRLIERLQQKAPAGSPTIEQYHALEQHMRTVLGLDVHPTVYLAPRSPADVVLPASKVYCAGFRAFTF